MTAPLLCGECGEPVPDEMRVALLGVLRKACPCPFCGGEGTFGALRKVECANCDGIGLDPAPMIAMRVVCPRCNARRAAMASKAMSN